MIDGSAFWPGILVFLAALLFATVMFFGFSVALYVVIFFVAPYFSEAMNAPTAAGVLRLASLTVVIDGISAVPGGLLTREFRQGRRATAEWVGFVVSTGLTVFLADAVLDGGTDAMLARFRDPEQRARIARAFESRIGEEPGDASLVVLSSPKAEKNRGLAGRSLADVAKARGTDAGEAALQLLEEEGGEVSFIGHAMLEANVERVLAHPLVMVGTTFTLLNTAAAGATRTAPTSYAAFARTAAALLGIPEPPALAGSDAPDLTATHF